MKSKYKGLIKFFRYLIPYRKKQIAIVFLGSVSVLLGLVNPYLSKLVVDRVIINKELKVFITLGFIGAVVYIINGLLKSLENILEKSMRLMVSFDLNKRIFEHLYMLSLDFFKDRSTGEHMFKINYDIERIVDFIVSVPKELIGIFLKLLFILAIIFYLDWRMAVFSLMLAPIMYLPYLFFTRRIRNLLEESWGNSQNIFKRMQEIFSHIYLIKAFGKEKTERRNYLQALLDNMRISLRNMRLEAMSSLFGASFERAIVGLIALFGGYQVVKGRITPGTFTAIMIYLTQLIALQNNIAFFFQKIFMDSISCGRIDEILNERPKVQEIAQAKKIIFNTPKIRFKGVSFGYSQSEYILKRLNFEIGDGFIALVGPSGCGKTTILNLALRLYEPWEGEIVIEGNNIKDLALSSLKEQVAIALQEPFLWNDTIENNIRYAKIKATTEEIIEAASLAAVDDFVKDFPNGYKTVAGESACKLSQGQKQKIAIARALLKKPKILILDEAMSSMDSESEEKIISNIRTCSEIQTTIIVSHRLSTVLACDLACFLKGSDKVIVDKPQSFNRGDKMFSDLFASQTRESLVSEVVV